jgi:hypothetical protein
MSKLVAVCVLLAALAASRAPGGSSSTSHKLPGVPTGRGTPATAKVS